MPRVVPKTIGEAIRKEPSVPTRRPIPRYTYSCPRCTDIPVAKVEKDYVPATIICVHCRQEVRPKIHYPEGYL